jgi:uncharacterized membrane protein
MTDMSPEKILAYCLMYVFGVGLFALIMANMPTSAIMSAWTFVGSEIVAALFPVIPYLFLAAMLILPSYFIIKEL